MSRRGTHRIASLTLGTALLLIAFGGFTRGSGSGYGCADRWPLCENGLLGGILPRPEFHMVVEWTHRWIAATLGILILATVVVAWRSRLDTRRVSLPATATLLAVALEALLGRQVVKGGLAADLVTWHLALSMAIVGLLTAVVVATGPPPAGRADRRWTRALTAAAAGAFLLMLLGSAVHDLPFPGWPLMSGGILPPHLFSNPYVALHLLHRITAAALLPAVWLLRVGATRRDRPRRERRLLSLALGLFVVEIGVGAGHVFTRVSSSLLVALHLGLAGIVWVVLLAAALHAARWSATDLPAPETTR